MRYPLAGLCLFVLTAATHAKETQNGGPAEYVVDNGVIAGRSVPNTPNRFLCSNWNDGDCFLELGLKVPPEFNSGIQIGRHSLPDDEQRDIESKSIVVLIAAADPSPAPAPKSPAAPVVAAGAEVKKLHGGFAFTEGPASGPDGKIYFTDIPNSRIHTHNPVSGALDIAHADTGRANGLMFDRFGALYACEGGNRRLTKRQGNNIEVLVTHFEGKKFNSPNDLDLDNKGGVYFTDPRYGDRDDMEMDVEGVYYFSSAGRLKRVIDDLIRPNGLILSLDNKTLYVADNGTTFIFAYDVRDDGSLANRRRFTDMGGEGGCDGMTIDELGNVYGTAQGSVWIWNPHGQLITRIKPPEAPSNCTFGGPDNATLFITARTGFYSIEMNVAGHESSRGSQTKKRNQGE